MSAAALISLEDYLKASCEPACEYLDGELFQKAMGGRPHARLQSLLSRVLFRFEELGLCQVVVEQSVLVREGAVLIPDVCLLRADDSSENLVTIPALLCIEILSPSDRFSYTVKKCREYLNWGVPFCWILDPEERNAWVSDASGLHPVPAGGMVEAGPFSLALAEIFPGVTE